MVSLLYKCSGFLCQMTLVLYQSALTPFTHFYLVGTITWKLLDCYQIETGDIKSAIMKSVFFSGADLTC